MLAEAAASILGVPSFPAALMDVLSVSAVAAARAIPGQAAIEAARIHRPARNAPVKDGCARPWARNSSVSGMSVVPFRPYFEVLGYIEAGPPPHFPPIFPEN